MRDVLRVIIFNELGIFDLKYIADNEMLTSLPNITNMKYTTCMEPKHSIQPFNNFGGFQVL